MNIREYTRYGKVWKKAHVERNCSPFPKVTSISSISPRSSQTKASYR